MAKINVWDVAGMLAAAEQRTGLDDWGESAFRDGLAALVESVNLESESLGVKPEGLEIEYQEVMSRLCGRLKLFNDRKENPEIAKQLIEKPIFVVGLPRTGTTHMHHLMSLDPANRTPALWEILRPSPPPVAATRNNDPRIAEVEASLLAAGLSDDTFANMHIFSARNPEECNYILEYAFRSQNQAAKIQKPIFMKWLQQADMVPGFEYHKMLLQHLQWRCPGERWVLKSPQLMCHLKALLEIYPDATLVVTHRNPKKALPSILSLCHTVQSIYHTDLDSQIEIDKCLTLQPRAVREMMALYHDPACRDRFVHVRFSDLARDSAACIKSVYEHADIAFTPDIERRIDQHMRENPRHKHGEHSYGLSDFGLNEAIIEDHFGDYIAEFEL